MEGTVEEGVGGRGGHWDEEEGLREKRGRDVRDEGKSVVGRTPIVTDNGFREQQPHSRDDEQKLFNSEDTPCTSNELTGFNKLRR